MENKKNHNLTNAEHDARRKKELKILSLKYKRVFNSQDGRDIIEDLEKRCFEHRTPAVPGDPHMTYHNIGRNSVLKRIKNMRDMRFDEPDAPRSYEKGK